MNRLAVNLPKLSRFINRLIVLGAIVFAGLGYYLDSGYYIGAGIFGFFVLINFYLIYIQKDTAVLRNFGLFGQMRYILMSIGPELRQYLYASDTEEKPFNRAEREEVYQKAQGKDSTSSFGSLDNFDSSEVKIRHSFYAVDKDKVKPFSVTFGEERGIKNTYTITKPVIISAMSFGALGEHAVRALSRGAKRAGIPMNTGEGGYPKYHLLEGADLIWQMGTAKFGARNDDGSLNEAKLKKIASEKNVKMIEIKFSQGAKPGKGGLLPAEKITKEIASLRHVSMGKDVVSPPHHKECVDAKSTVAFIGRVQKLVGKPVGIKFCLGSDSEFREMVKEMKRQKTFPDYIDVDGAQGGTGAAPKSYMDDIGVPLFPALHAVQNILVKEGVRGKLKLLSSGKLINPGKQMIALSLGADACYTARGFMLALGCIQALQCNRNTCPVGITTHRKELQHGLDIEDKAKRVVNYVASLEHEFYELLASTGKKTSAELSVSNLYIPDGYPIDISEHS
jgi:glutamate synthase domain-containing protein 2